ncbi:MAG: hypothetical protein PVF74_06670 [Anaerolineales bacterium]
MTIFWMRSSSSVSSTWVDTYRHLNPRGEAATHELCLPWGAVLRRARLDYIFMKPGPCNWRVVTAGHIALDGQRYSDHRPVWAQLVPMESDIQSEHN